MSVARIDRAFAEAAAQNRATLVLYVMAGDPNIEETSRILDGLVEGGADIIELGFAFSDPMADGPSIQAAAIRALENKITLRKTLDIVADFRAKHKDTALVLMGYLNPVESFGFAEFAKASADAGVDGFIIVDAPAEEDGELRIALAKYDLALIRLATPTTDEKRLPAVIANTTGFVYYVSVAGVTGGKAIDTNAIKDKVALVKKAANLPVAIGFGIRNEEAAHQTAQIADGIVIGAALVDTLHSAFQNGEDCKTIAREFAAKMKAAAYKD